MKKIFCALIGICLLTQIQTIFASDSLPVPYEWNNMPLGASGFITGSVYHPFESDLVYIRTDVGGAYKWDKTNNRWVQLCDIIDRKDGHLYGIDGIAIDPQNPDIVYIAAGNSSYYTGDVLKSEDRGNTWKRMGFNKYFDANGSYRSRGECIAVDPNNSSIVYCGTAKEGLWKSTNGALSWTKVSGIAASSMTNQVRNIVFDKNSADMGISQTIYAGVTNVGIYRSTDGGSSWSLIPGTPTNTNRMEVGNSGALYVASNKGLFKFADDVWSEISPAGSTGKSINGVSLDPNDENTIMCVGYNVNTSTMSIPIFRSTDGGETWKNLMSTKVLSTPIPWQVNNVGFSSNTADIKIDPVNPKRVMICDWFGVWITDDITASSQTWTHPIYGIEETVAFNAVSLPNGYKYRLMVGVADVDGMVYENVNEYPKRQLISLSARTTPYMMSTTQLDFCEANPNYVLRVGLDYNSNGRVEISSDSTETWKNITNIPKNSNGTAKKYGRMAISSRINPSTGKPTLMIIPVNNIPLYSADLGATWTSSAGISDSQIVTDYWSRNTPLAADRVTGSKFYMYAHNNVFVSNDWGASFTKTASITGNNEKAKIKAAPYVSGSVWLGFDETSIGNRDGALYRSSNGGTSFEKLPNITSVVSFGFGKEADGHTNPTIYLFGVINNVEGMYRSIDMGETWVKINDEFSKLGTTPFVVEGDRQEFGVVYAGTGGRGFFYGKPKIARSDYVQYNENFDDSNPADWQIANMSVQNKTLKNNNSGTEGSAINEKNNFSGNYKYSLKMKFNGSSMSNSTRIIFNYINKYNYYYLEFYNGKATLAKKVDDVNTIKGSVISYNEDYIDTKINVYYDVGGYISVDIIKNGFKTRLFDKIKDTSFTAGEIGIYTTDSVSFDDISVDNGIVPLFDYKIMKGTSVVTSLANVKGDDVNVVLSNRNNSMEDVNSSIIVVIKDGEGKVRDLRSALKTFSGISMDTTIPIKIPIDAANDFKVYCYFWNSTENIMPIAQKVNILQ